MVEKHDIVIVGGGPAGCKAAQTLAEGGKEDVLVLEKTGGKHLGEKICSGMLMANNMAIFKIPKDICDTYIDMADIYSQKKTLEIKFPYPLCYMMDRRNGKFGKWLLEQTRKMGVEIRPDSIATKIHREDHLIELKNGEKIKYKDLVIANGSGGEFRRQLGLTTDSVLCTHIEVPYSDIPDKRKTTGHLYLNFNVNGVGYSGYTPYKESIGFCQVMANDKFFTKRERMQRFNEYVKRIEGVDLKDYEILAKPVNYKPIDIYQGDNISVAGETAGYGDIAGGLIATCAKSGEIAAKGILGGNISNEIRTYHQKYKGKTSKFVNSFNNKFIVKNLMESIIPKAISNKRFVPKRVYNKLLNKVASLFIPFDGDEWNEFNQDYYSSDRFGLESIEIEEI